VVPVIRNAGTKNIQTLTREIADFAARGGKGFCRKGFNRRTFTISNAGMLDWKALPPLINYPRLPSWAWAAVARPAAASSMTAQIA